ncbi:MULTISPECIES: hypothetical protein [unclassified Phyllobacterium]|uniref:hypothetical protein n=1 Tax=unclassified Phyllobacterium TaxID=2638441 RepID=UPI003012CCAB
MRLARKQLEAAFPNTEIPPRREQSPEEGWGWKFHASEIRREHSIGIDALFTALLMVGLPVIVAIMIGYSS